jgi:hypothetical protein
LPHGSDPQAPHRKLTFFPQQVNVSKTESIIAAHPGKSLEDLLAQKIINADQKQQVINKPSLTNQATQLEEQLAQFKKLQGEFRTKAQTDRAEFEKSSTESRDKAIADALKEQEEKLVAQHQKELSDTLLHLSQFLRLAASRRAEDCDHSLDENLAIEGVLLGVYTGDKAAVDCILKLTRGTNDTTVSVSNEPCQTTCKHIVWHSLPTCIEADNVFRSRPAEGDCHRVQQAPRLRCRARSRREPRNRPDCGQRHSHRDQGR